MAEEPPRSRLARQAAEHALVRVVHHYGSRPEFVVLGGLVPDLLCRKSSFIHAGTTDVDVQVNLEIASGAINAPRLEQALTLAGFQPEARQIWRWRTGPGGTTLVKFELLADLPTQPSEQTIRFDSCRELGAVNLRGTGFAARDVTACTLTADVDGIPRTTEVSVTGLAGFLLAKAAAALAVRKQFANDLVGSVRTALNELFADFADPRAQGPIAYCGQMLLDHPELDRARTAADSIAAVNEFRAGLFPEA